MVFVMMVMMMLVCVVVGMWPMVLCGGFNFRWGMQVENMLTNSTGRLKLRVAVFSRGVGVFCRGMEVFCRGVG